MSAFPIDRVRREFPALSQSHDGRPRVFMDNPAGTQLPRRVVDAVSNALVNAASNYGGFFENSRNAEAIYASAHGAMADFVNAHSPNEIVVAQSMTALTLHVSRSLGRRFAPGDEIVVTRMDHEGNVSPWLLLAEDLDLVVRWLPFDLDTWKIEPEDLQALLGPRTRLLALNYASNLTGSVNDVAELVALARSAGAMTFVDAVQLAPHQCIDVRALDCDFLVCSSYKFFGPTWECCGDGGHCSTSWRPTRCVAPRTGHRRNGKRARRRPSCSRAWPHVSTTTTGWAARWVRWARRAHDAVESKRPTGPPRTTRRVW